jgi:nitrate reductase delta subunit
MKTFRTLGLLLSYPQPAWLAHLGELRQVIADEGLLPPKHRKAVLGFIDALGASDPLLLQERYVATFDRGRSHSLHLFEHIHGESRDRGQAMVDLAAAYAEKGLVISRAELPDYLPLFLEFLSCCTPQEASELLSEPVEVIAAIGARLRDKDSPYAALFDALVGLSKARPRQDWLGELLAEAPDDSLEALDREWEEAAAFARPSEQAGCQGCAAHTPGLHVKTL